VRVTDDRYPMLVPDYLADLEHRSIDEVRSMRSDCVAVETSVSYVRRMVQGRLDIVAAERQRREAGEAPADMGQLIGRLPEILGDHGRPPGLGRLPQSIEPPEPDPELLSRLDTVAGAGLLTSLPEMSDAELAEVAAQLEALEHDVSGRRRDLFDRIDALQSELTRRYRSGEADVESLLGDK
jgi:hypothetical protein